jgi:hypothetical protein
MRKKLQSQKRYDDVDVFILKNWWKMSVPGLEKEPGLRAWSSKAAIKLLEFRKVYRASFTPMVSRIKWYHDRCRKWDYVPFKPPYVLDVEKTGRRWVVTKAETRIIWRAGRSTGEDWRDFYSAWRVIE